MQVPVKVQWGQLCDSVEKLELEIAQTDFPIPTPQMCKLLIVTVVPDPQYGSSTMSLGSLLASMMRLSSPSGFCVG